MSHLVGQQISVKINEISILDKTDIDLAPGELLGLIGPNGAGKTTLLRALAGLLDTSSGNVQFDGVDLAEMSAMQRAKKVAYLAQNGEVHWPVQVERLVELGRTPHLSAWQHLGGEDKEIVRQAMLASDTWDLRKRIYNTLSGGERMRVLLARALAVQPEIILADEPVAALDLAHQIDVMDLLRTHCDAGGSAVVVLHDLSLAAHYCHRLQLLDHGLTMAVGSPSEVLTAENLQQAYHIELHDPDRTLADAFRLQWRSTNFTQGNGA
jgi:iron complex transport system ATP-binding protein